MSFRLGYFLVQQDCLSVEAVDRAMRRQQLLGGSLDTNLLELQLITIDRLEEVLPQALAVPAPAQDWLSQPAQDALSCLPFTLLQQLQMVPVAMDAGVVHFLAADVGPPPQLATLEYWLGRRATVYPIPQIRLFQAMHKLYGLTIPQRLAALAQRFPATHLFVPPAGKVLPLASSHTDGDVHQVYSVASAMAASGLMLAQPPEATASVLPVTPSQVKKLSAPNPAAKALRREDDIVTNPDVRELQDTQPQQGIVVKKKAKALPSSIADIKQSTLIPNRQEEVGEPTKQPVRHVDVKPEPNVSGVSGPGPAAEAAGENVTANNRTPHSALNLPAADALRNAFRNSAGSSVRESLVREKTRVEERDNEKTRVEGRDNEKTRVEERDVLRAGEREATRVEERNALEQSGTINPMVAASAPPQLSLRDTVTVKQSDILVREQTNSEPVVALTEADAALDEEDLQREAESSELSPFETSHDLSLAVKILQKAKESEKTEPKAIFELSELFSAEGQGATMPGLPAFPPTQVYEADIFPEVTQMDVSRQTLTDDEQSEVVALKDVALDDINQAHKLELDELLSTNEPAERERLVEGLVRYGASLVPAVLSYIPTSGQMNGHNPVLKERFQRLVEVCEAIGEPALFRMLQLLEKSEEEAQRRQILTLLGYWRPPRAIAPLLQRLFSETKPSIQRMICNNLRRYRGQEEFHKLLQFLRENLTSDHPHRLQKALFYLGHLRITEATTDVIGLLEHSQSEIQEYALETLRLLTLQNYNGDPKAWRSWWALNGTKTRKQWVIDAMNHPQIVVRQRVKEELRLEFGDDFGYEPTATPEERDTVRKLAALWIKQS